MVLSSGRSTLTQRKRDWSGVNALTSTSKTSPSPSPITLLAYAFIKSKGEPYTWTHSWILGKETFIAVIPFSHLLRTSKWLSKHQRPFSITHFNWLSNENLNWRSPSPNSTIFRSLPIRHTVWSKFFAALRLTGLSLKKRPRMLRVHSSKISLWWCTRILISSSSSSVKEIFHSLSKDLKSMSTTTKRAVW